MDCQPSLGRIGTNTGIRALVATNRTQPVQPVPMLQIEINPQLGKPSPIVLVLVMEVAAFIVTQALKLCPMISPARVMTVSRQIIEATA